jgi:hypothetical protein
MTCCRSPERTPSGGCGPGGQTSGGGSGTADQRFVGALYELLLSRAGDPAGLAAAAANLPPLGARGVARSFLTGQEFRTDQFEGYYDGLLNRPPTPRAGPTSWRRPRVDRVSG